jgi:hypothetical protein
LLLAGTERERDELYSVLKHMQTGVSKETAKKNKSKLFGGSLSTASSGKNNTGSSITLTTTTTTTTTTNITCFALSGDWYALLFERLAVPSGGKRRKQLFLDALWADPRPVLAERSASAVVLLCCWAAKAAFTSAGTGAPSSASSSPSPFFFHTPGTGAQLTFFSLEERFLAAAAEGRKADFENCSALVCGYSRGLTRTRLTAPPSSSSKAVTGGSGGSAKGASGSSW